MWSEPDGIKLERRRWVAFNHGLTQRSLDNWKLLNLKLSEDAFMTLVAQAVSNREKNRSGKLNARSGPLPPDPVEDTNLG